MAKEEQTKKREWLNYSKAIVFLLILSIFIILKTAFTPKPDLAKEAEIVLTTLTDGRAEVSLVNPSNELIEEKLKNLNQMGYNEIKNILKVKHDFCIFFEDVTGNIIKIDGVDSGMGSDKIHINGEPCK